MAKKFIRFFVTMSLVMTLGVGIVNASSNVFVSSVNSARMIDGPTGTDTYSKNTTKNESSYSASFKSTIHYTTSWKFTSYSGSATLFNITKSYNVNNAKLWARFNYTGMGQTSNGTFVQVNSSMEHQY